MAKHLSTIFLLLTFLILSAECQVRIDGQIIGYKGNKKVNYCISPTWSLGYDGSVQPDSLGRFSILERISGTQFFCMSYRAKGKVHYCQLIIRPDEHYQIISEGYDLSEGFDPKTWTKAHTPDIYTCEKVDDGPMAFFKEHSGQIYFNLSYN